MNDEIPAGPPPAAALAPPPTAPRGPSAVRRRLAHWLGELVTVFVGVYAAFFLNYRAGHRQERQRREQLLTWVEDRYTQVLDNSRRQIPALRARMDEFNAKLAAGGMPEIKPITWSGDYDPADGTGLLQSGGYDLLEIATIRDIRDTESALRQLVAVAVHGQQRSDAMILPNRGSGDAAFYDPTTHRLRESYEWVPKVYEDLLEDFKALQNACDKLLAQVRAERQRLR